MTLKKGVPFLANRTTNPFCPVIVSLEITRPREAQALPKAYQPRTEARNRSKQALIPETNHPFNLH